jgi:hypothetical protein
MIVHPSAPPCLIFHWAWPPLVLASFLRHIVFFLPIFAFSSPLLYSLFPFFTPSLHSLHAPLPLSLPPFSTPLHTPLPSLLIILLFSLFTSGSSSPLAPLLDLLLSLFLTPIHIHFYFNILAHTSTLLSLRGSTVPFLFL